MNDRFKFRLWCNQFNQYMAFPQTISGINKHGNIYCPECCIIEQCTGLTDKNGRLIYEGDIVIFHTESEYGDKFYYTKPVVYHTQLALFGFPVTHDGDYKMPIENYANALYQAEWDKEVIGNIHENPELIENVSIEKHGNANNETTEHSED